MWGRTDGEDKRLLIPLFRASSFSPVLLPVTRKSISVRHVDGCLNSRNACGGRRRGKDLAVSGCEWCMCVCTAAIWKTQIKAWKQRFVFCHERRANANSLLFLNPQITFLTQQSRCSPAAWPVQDVGPHRPHCWSFAPLAKPCAAESKFYFQQQSSSSSSNEKVDGVLESDTKHQIALDSVGVWMLNSPGNPVSWRLCVCLCILIQSRGFSCKHRLLPPPLNPLSVGDRKIRTDHTQNWFLI